MTTAVIGSVERVLLPEAGGAAWNPDKTMATWPVGNAHALEAVDLAAGLSIFKTWVNTPGVATPRLADPDADELPVLWAGRRIADQAHPAATQQPRETGMP